MNILPIPTANLASVVSPTDWDLLFSLETETVLVT